MARRREFKDAMRQRIRDIAASRDLSDEEIKPALTLKHHEIGKFTEKHGVNLEWLLEGKGGIFKKDPIRLSPNMTGDGFAAVVATMPMADQQAIRTKIAQIAQEQGNRIERQRHAAAASAASLIVNIGRVIGHALSKPEQCSAESN